MGAAGSNVLKTRETRTEVAELISKGKSRKDIVEFLKGKGMESSNAYKLYYEGLQDMVPEEDFLTTEKKYLIQQNLDRLETIINTCIDGNFQQKTVALKAISELNKMISAYGDNGVVINKNKEGDEQIIIKFDR